MGNSKGPQFLRFFIPVIEVLKELGGSGTPSEVTDLVIERLNIPENEQEEILKKSGLSRVRNQVAWARSYLVKSELLDSSQRGIWNLTEKGRKVKITEKDVRKYFKTVQSSFIKKKEHSKIETKDSEIIDDQTIPDDIDSKTELLNLLQDVSPNGFERICQRLLRESGFEQVTVTGKSGDGGIDGIGILQVNPFVSFRVLFQSKRYKGSVSASQVRDFRGAMMGRADKGIIITTGTFTVEAKKEARRDGVTPIELVDGDKLVEMFKRLEFGLKPKKIYELDHNFFREYEL